MYPRGPVWLDRIGPDYANEHLCEKIFLKSVDKLSKFCYNITIVKENRKEKTMLLCELDVMEYAVTMEEAVVDEDFFDYKVEDDFDECGYNPYMGCYDFDC